MTKAAHERFNMELDSLRLKVILGTIVINVAAVVLFSFMPGSNWRTGVLLNFIDNFILVTYMIKTKDRLMGHLILFGLTLGFVELFADAYLVDVTKTLDYSIGGGPMIWRSPIWMPFAWEVVGVQFGYIGMRLFERWKVWGLAAAGILGGLNIPFYEEMALRTHWWQYHRCKMLLHTPYYIILGEFAIVVAFALLARPLRKLRMSQTLLSGVLAGIAIYVCYWLAYLVVEG